VPGGNIPATIPAIEVKMTFKEGGAFDFHSTYERIKERMQQVVDIARESGALTQGQAEDGRADMGGVNLDSVHLDELPAYEDASRSPLLGGREAQRIVEERTRRVTRSPDSASSPAGEVMSSEPPRYEEVQRESVADELERRLRRES
jgi:hypothetical protein